MIVVNNDLYTYYIYTVLDAAHREYVRLNEKWRARRILSRLPGGVQTRRLFEAYRRRGVFTGSAGRAGGLGSIVCS